MVKEALVTTIGIVVRFILLAVVLFVGALLFYEPVAHSANIPLEIIQPRPVFTNNNRFSYAHPGIEYNVKIAVIGGTWPFTYSIDSIAGDPGLTQPTIDPGTGVLSWPAAWSSTTATTLNITVKVVDFEGTPKSVTWRVNQNTSLFIFVDSINGTKSSCNGGNNSSGSSTQPYKTIADWYCGSTFAAKHTTANANKLVYYRTGTYVNDAYHESQQSETLSLVNLEKPVIHMAYPGETANLDMSTGGWLCEANCTNMYIDGFNVINIAPVPPFTNSIFAFLLESGSTSPGSLNRTVRRNTFNGTPAKNSNGQNPSLIFFSESNISPAVWGAYASATENRFLNIQNAYTILMYTLYKALIADNFVDVQYDTTGFGLSHGFGLKVCNQMVSIRNNEMRHIGTAAYPDADALESLYTSALNGNTCSNAGLTGTSNIDYSFNKVISSYGHSLNINSGVVDVGGPVWINRNTFTSSTFTHRVTPTNGPFYWYNNVIVNNYTFPSHVNCTDGCTDLTRLLIPVVPTTNGNLTGVPADNIVDVNGELTANYLQYRGIKGHSTGAATPSAIPSAPGGLGNR